MQAKATRVTARVNAFTLVELLVVIAVIAILIGVLLPALAGARAAGQKSVCAGNLKSIATLMNVYGNDYDTEFPVIPFVPTGLNLNGEDGGGPATFVRRLPSYIVAQGQGWAGGFAGFFSYDQENKDPLAKAKTDDKGAIWGTRGGRGAWTTADEGKAIPVMRPYIESNADYGMLQCPSDKLDGGESGMPAVKVGRITDDKDVCWHNISYMYIAGLNQRTPQLGLLGDETNALDWGNTKFKEIVGATGSYGTLRKDAPATEKPGYHDVDNHGTAGGNFAYTDAHVEWIPQRFGVKQNSQYAVGFDPHDRIFAEIQQFLSGGTGNVQTID